MENRDNPLKKEGQKLAQNTFSIAKNNQCFDANTTRVDYVAVATQLPITAENYWCTEQFKLVQSLF